MSEDFGVKVSQDGAGVLTAADFQLLFSSGWPALKIEKEGSYVITSAADQVIFEHNLGYVPAFFVCDYTSGYSTSNPATNNKIGINKRELKFFSAGGAINYPVKIYYYVFRLNIELNFTAPIVQQGMESPKGGGGDFGIKIAKEGKSIDSNDLRDFVIHSGTQSPMIHQVAKDITIAKNSSAQDVWAVVANHKLGYYPLFFPYVAGASSLPKDYYGFTGNFSQAVPRVFGTTDSTQIDLILASQTKPNGAALVIFKDPYSLTATQVSLKV